LSKPLDSLEQIINDGAEMPGAGGVTDGDKRGMGQPSLRRRIAALFGVLADMFGSDGLILRAGKLGALAAMRSPDLAMRVLALQKIIMEDPTLDDKPGKEALQQCLTELEEEVADQLARRSLEEDLERRVAERMQQRHEEYMLDMKRQILKDDSGPETEETRRKMEQLRRLETKSLSRSAMEVLKPRSYGEVVGQDKAITSLVAKIASPYPQHVLLYGPPGVGKTTVARLVLEEARRLPHTPFAGDAPFVEVDGATLRWDPREVTNPLLGSVHDPIYQGAKRDLAEDGIPEPKLGLATEAHGGILFIDEVGEMDPLLQGKLLKVLEEKRVTFDSSYYDPADPRVPEYVRQLFEAGAPADFILIGATTRMPDELSPALRSRCAEVFFAPLTPEHIKQIVTQAVDRLDVRLEAGVAATIAEFTREGRKATQLLADAYGLALYRSRSEILVADVLEVAQSARLSPLSEEKAKTTPEQGRVFGLGVAGYTGGVIEIEAAAFPAREAGKGTVRFNDAAGKMARDSVFNAMTVARAVTGLDPAEYDLHVNIVGGGLIDGPSAGAGIVIALVSALLHKPVHQDVAVTGEISLSGKVRAVGGINEKIFGALTAGMRKVVLPSENKKETPSDLKAIEVVFADTLEDMLSHVMA